MTRLRTAVDRHPHLVVAALCTAGLALAPWRYAGAAALAGSLSVVALLKAVDVRPALGLLAGLALVGGAAIGTVRIHAIDSTAGRVQPGDRVGGDVVVLERPRPSRFGSSAVVRLESGARVLARADGGMRWPSGGEPGTIVAVTGNARAPARSASSGFDWPAFLRRRGIRVEVALDTLRPTGRRRGGVEGTVDAMRRRAEHALSLALPRDKAALARGMVLGQDESIDGATRDDFRASGLAHLLAVSGQNVMLLAALAMPFFVAAGASPRQRAVALLVLIAVYVPLAGAGPSLQRAGAMGAAGAIALAAGRVSSRWYALLLAALVTLTLNPRAAADPGWQLSFAAVVGILVLGTRLRDALVRVMPRPAAEGIAITVAATLATAPLVGHHFGSVSVSGLVANVLALPVVAPIMWLGMSAAALAQLPALAPGLQAPVDAAAAGMGAIDGVLLGYLRWLARVFAEVPGATTALPLASSPAVAGAYLAMAAVALLAVRKAGRLEPRVTPLIAAWDRRPRHVRITVLAGGCAAAALALVAWTRTPSPPDRLTVSFLDVGQGDATLIQDGAGASVLFDGGPPEARVYRRLKAAGVRRLDLMVSTHQSRDHQGGLHEVLARIPTRLLLENGYGTRDPDYHRLIAEADARGVRHVPARAGQVLQVGRLTIRVFGPRPRAPGEPPPDEPNPIGVAAIVSEGPFDLWLSADAESEAILQYPLRPVEAMKVSHHGSRDPGLPQVLRRLQPQVAAIEVGAGNSYGHPAPETLAALRAAVPHVYRTDEDGTVRLAVDGGRMTIARDK